MSWLRISLVAIAIVWAVPAEAQVAYDNFTACTTATDPGICNHIPAGTPRAVIVLVYISDSTDQVNSCTYGGDAMTEVPTVSPLIKATGEDNGVFAYFLGTSIPTSAQDASCDMTNAVSRRMRVITLTGNADTEIVDADFISSDSVQDPTVVLALNNRPSFVMIGGASGHNALVSDMDPLASWTIRSETDVGVDGYFTYTYDVIGTTDVTAGIDDAAADDIVAIAIAVSEIGSGSTCGKRTLLGVGC